jgi:hypothetical protein
MPSEFNKEDRTETLTEDTACETNSGGRRTTQAKLKVYLGKEWLAKAGCL